eukprot:361294-Chlamydomonas_euryale.AAC.4
MLALCAGSGCAAASAEPRRPWQAYVEQLQATAAGSSSRRYSLRGKPRRRTPADAATSKAAVHPASQPSRRQRATVSACLFPRPAERPAWCALAPRRRGPHLEAEAGTRAVRVLQWPKCGGLVVAPHRIIVEEEQPRARAGFGERYSSGARLSKTRRLRRTITRRRDAAAVLPVLPTSRQSKRLQTSQRSAPLHLGAGHAPCCWWARDGRMCSRATAVKGRCIRTLFHIRTEKAHGERHHKRTKTSTTTDRIAYP